MKVSAVKIRVHQKPDISIIIPVWNVEDYLEQCLDSLLTQTVKNIEILCVDDGSTDTSFQMLQKYQHRDSRVIALKNTSNTKSSATARNVGLDYAKGLYVLFVDADDLLPSNDVLSTLLNHAKKYDSEETIGKVQRWYFQEDGRVEEGYHESYQNKPFINKNVVQAPQIFRQVVVWNKLYKNAFLQKHHFRFNSNILRGEDLPFSIKAHFKAKKISVIDKWCYTYRIRNVADFSKRYTYRQVNSKNECLIYEYLFSFFKENYDEEKINCFFSSYPNRVIDIIRTSFLELHRLKATKFIFLDRIRHWEAIFKKFTPKPILKQLRSDFLLKSLYHGNTTSTLRYLNLIFGTNLEPSCSIIIYIHNSSEYLDDLFNTIQQQLMEDAEILFIDDHSQDNSFPRIKEFISHSEKCFLLKHEQFLGSNISKKLGWKLAASKLKKYLEVNDFQRNAI